MTFAGATPELSAYWIEHLRLQGLEDRLPADLSGASVNEWVWPRCSAPRPKCCCSTSVLSLDVPVRLELRRELRRLQRETGLATVLVTHDPEEAAFLSDELIVLAEGTVLQSGTSRSVFSRPVSAEVAKLLGSRI